MTNRLRTIACPDCNGLGAFPKTGMDCGRCFGGGEIDGDEAYGAAADGEAHPTCGDGLGRGEPAPDARREIPGKLEYFEGKLMPVVDASRSGWWRFHEHYDRNGYCDNPGRGY